jgi:hypothetical protein
LPLNQSKKTLKNLSFDASRDLPDLLDGALLCNSLGITALLLPFSKQSGSKILYDKK